MTLEVVWTRPALRHLKSIETYLSRHSPAATKRILSRIAMRSNQLSRFPELAPVGREAGTRELVVVGTRYVLAYRIEKDRVIVLAVVHGSQDWRGYIRRT